MRLTHTLALFTAALASTAVAQPIINSKNGLRGTNLCFSTVCRTTASYALDSRTRYFEYAVTEPSEFGAYERPQRMWAVQVGGVTKAFGMLNFVAGDTPAGLHERDLRAWLRSVNITNVAPLLPHLAPAIYEKGREVPFEKQVTVRLGAYEFGTRLIDASTMAWYLSDAAYAPALRKLFGRTLTVTEVRRLTQGVLSAAGLTVLAGGCPAGEVNVWTPIRENDPAWNARMERAHAYLRAQAFVPRGCCGSPPTYMAPVFSRTMFTFDDRTWSYENRHPAVCFSVGQR